MKWHFDIKKDGHNLLKDASTHESAIANSSVKK